MSILKKLIVGGAAALAAYAVKSNVSKPTAKKAVKKVEKAPKQIAKKAKSAARKTRAKVKHAVAKHA